MKPKKSKFNLSHQRKLTAPFGKLIPCYVQEVLPGDTIRCKSEIMTKMFPMSAPIYHHVDVYTEYFFVPNRLLWQTTSDSKAPLDGPANAWEAFMTGSFDTTQSTADWLGRKVPTIKLTDPANKDGSLFDFFGMPQPTVASGSTNLDKLLISQMPFRAYHKIYYDWYINEWIQADEVRKADASFRGDAWDSSWGELKYRNWQHGYFTDALPSTQKGSVQIPVMSNTSDTPHKHLLDYTETDGSRAGHEHYLGYHSHNIGGVVHNHNIDNVNSGILAHTHDYSGTSSKDLTHSHLLEDKAQHTHIVSRFDFVHRHDIDEPTRTEQWTGPIGSQVSAPGYYSEVGSTEDSLDGAPVTFGFSGTTTQGTKATEYSQTLNSTINPVAGPPTDGTTNPPQTGNNPNAYGYTGMWNPNASASSAYYIDPNDLRYAVQLQKFLERNARAGNRYTEFLQSHFGAHNRDSRLQRAEFLGGGRSPIVVSEVLQTSESDTTNDKPLGGYAGHGVGASGRHGFGKRHFTEHGWIIGLMSIMPKQEYGGQGLPRQFTHLFPTDFAFPEFAHLGEQEIYKYELCVKDQPNMESDVFGYAPRYEEYRHGEVQGGICGSMRYVTGDTKHPGGLDFWHMNRKFVEWDSTVQTEKPVVPTLSKDFISAKDITHRIFPVVENDPYITGDVLFAHIINHVHARRCLPKIARPGMLDHF